MTDWQCARCRAQVAPGAPRCPQCPSTSFIKPEPEADMLKIARDGTVSDSADVQPATPFPERLADAGHPADVAGGLRAEIAELREEVAGLEAQEPPGPRLPPRVPPRHATPPGGPVG